MVDGARGGARERYIENVFHMLSESKIATTVMFMYLEEIENIFIKWTWFCNVRIVMRNHNKDWDLYTCNALNASVKMAVASFYFGATYGAYTSSSSSSKIDTGHRVARFGYLARN